MKVTRIKVRDMISAGVMSVLPTNPARPDCDLILDPNGVIVHNHRNGEYLLVPFHNLVEIVMEPDVTDEEVEAVLAEQKQKRGRPKKNDA